MAEIKLNEGFTGEVAAFRASAEGFDAYDVSAVAGGNLSLPTVREYQNELLKMQGVMVLLQALIKKDAKDMDELAASLRAADNSGG